MIERGPLPQRPFGIIPVEVLSDPTLSDGAVRLFGLVDQALTGDDNDERLISALADRLGRSFPDLAHFFDELVERGYFGGPAS